MSDEGATERFRLLLGQLKREFEAEHGGKDHGWKVWAAERLDIAEEYVGMLLRDPKRSAGRKVIERAMKRLNIHSDFFYAPRLIDPKYRDYPRSRPALEPFLVREPEAAYMADADGDSAALLEFLRSGARAPIGADEYEELRRWAPTSHRKGGLRPEDFAERLDALRRGRELALPTKPESMDANSAAAVGKRRAEQQGGMPVRKRRHA